MSSLFSFCHFSRRHTARRRGSVTAFATVAIAAMLSGCAPTRVVHLRALPPATAVAMTRLPLLPLGTPIRLHAGEIAPVQGFACGPNPAQAVDQAEQQLRIKALEARADAVVDVVVTDSGALSCLGTYGAQAHGIAVASWAMPPTW